MGIITSIRHSIEDAATKHRSFLTSLEGEMLKLPDNPKAKRISTNIVIISSKELLNNWTAEYYNFKIQYKQIVAFLTNENLTPEQFLVRADKMIEEGRIYFNEKNILGHHTKRYQDLHPDVVANIKLLLYS